MGKKHGFFATDSNTNLNLAYEFGGITVDAKGNIAIVGTADYRTSKMILFMQLDENGNLARPIE